jgi:hypothetical protein
VAWPVACRHERFGELGIVDLHTMNLALQMRWVWLSRTEPDRAGASLQCPRNNMTRTLEAMFEASVAVQVNDGRSTLFWRDKWIHGQSVFQIAPNLLSAVSRRTQNSRTVFAALNNRRWVGDIRGGLSVQALLE